MSSLLSKTVKQMKTALMLFFILTIITGIIYPLIVTGIAQLFFPKKANGSLIIKNKKVIGSKLIGQSFTDSGYFWGRPSETSPFPYNPKSSSGSNLAPFNPEYLKTIQARIDTIQKANPDMQTRIPADLVTASGSGLDPHISPEAALYQVSRIAKARNLSPQSIRDLINLHVKPRSWYILGEATINVLELNLALDELHNANLKVSL